MRYLVYDEGPSTINMGAYQFQRGEVLPVAPDDAEGILAKGTIRFREVTEKQNNSERS